MDSLTRRWRDLPLRRFFLLSVLAEVGIVAVLSALIIWGCTSVRHWLLPDSEEVYLVVEKTLRDGSSSTEMYLMKFGESPSALPELVVEADGEPIRRDVEEMKYSLQKLEKSFDLLSPKRKFAYQACGAVMVAAPTFLAFVGTFVCSLYFYRCKLRKPLELLSDAAEKIAQQDLDFELKYDCGDEMGALCRSFEDMRGALWENNRVMWEMLEERKLLQASVAHDLRNPIAIIQGYTEYLDMSLQKKTLNQEKTGRIVRNLGRAAKRLEQYTESVRLLNRWEETGICRKSYSVRKLAEEIAEDMSLLAKQEGFRLRVAAQLPDTAVEADAALLCRVLENIISNALRYAREEICLSFILEEHRLVVTVTDDGCGFPEEILRDGGKKFLHPGEDGHMGIGLAVSRLLCRKHGGSMELSNCSGGACVKIIFSV